MIIAKKFIQSLPLKHARQIKAKIFALIKNLEPNDSKKLTGCNFLRTDSGEYRIIYSFDHHELLIILVGKRNDAEV